MLFIAACTYALCLASCVSRPAANACPWPCFFQAATLGDQSWVVTTRTGASKVGRRCARTGAGMRASRQGWATASTAGRASTSARLGSTSVQGLQMDCRSRGLCIDSDDVMVRIWLTPGGLIRYDTQAALSAARRPPARRSRHPSRASAHHRLHAAPGDHHPHYGDRARLKPLVDVTVLRDCAPLFVTLSDRNISITVIRSRSPTSAVRRTDLPPDLCLVSHCATGRKPASGRRGQDGAA